jgi:plasmid stabilization system protein ParE
MSGPAEVVFSAAALADLRLILDWLTGRHLDLGAPPDEAFESAARRVRAITTDALRLGTAPHRGTRDEGLAPGLRHATINRAIFYFDVRESAEGAAQVRILAVFFGGQDHRRQMLARLSD